MQQLNHQRCLLESHFAGGFSGLYGLAHCASLREAKRHHGPCNVDGINGESTMARFRLAGGWLRSAFTRAEILGRMRKPQTGKFRVAVYVAHDIAAPFGLEPIAFGFD